MDFECQLGSVFVFSIFSVLGDIWNCSYNRSVKLHEHDMKEVESVLDKMLCRMVTVDEMQLGFMLERGTIGVVFIRV